MTDRIFRLGLGAALLACFYYDQLIILACLVGYLVFEGLTNWRLPLMIARFRKQTLPTCGSTLLGGDKTHLRFNVDAEQAWRLMVAVTLVTSLYVLPQTLWWMAWFVGFALLGAGISGVCPMLMALKVAGFR
ncbi:MAG: YgaP-like transmembrane domain [Gammaproteobacteria bacterium]